MTTLDFNGSLVWLHLILMDHNWGKFAKNICCLEQFIFYFYITWPSCRQSLQWNTMGHPYTLPSLSFLPNWYGERRPAKKKKKKRKWWKQIPMLSKNLKKKKRIRVSFKVHYESVMIIHLYVICLGINICMTVTRVSRTIIFRSYITYIPCK